MVASTVLQLKATETYRWAGGSNRTCHHHSRPNHRGDPSTATATARARQHVVDKMSVHGLDCGTTPAQTCHSQFLSGKKIRLHIPDEVAPATLDCPRMSFATLPGTASDDCKSRGRFVSTRSLPPSNRRFIVFHPSIRRFHNTAETCSVDDRLLHLSFSFFSTQEAG